MQHQREQAQELQASTQAVLNKQAAAWSAACAALGQLLMQLCEAHDKHKDGHAALQSGIRKALEMTQQVQQRAPALHGLFFCCPRDQSCRMCLSVLLLSLHLTLLSKQSHFCTVSHATGGNSQAVACITVQICACLAAGLDVGSAAKHNSTLYNQLMAVWP